MSRKADKTSKIDIVSVTPPQQTFPKLTLPTPVNTQHNSVHFASSSSSDDDNSDSTEMDTSVKALKAYLIDLSNDANLSQPNT